NGEEWISPGAVNESIAQEFGIAGECRNVVAACATGAYAIAMGAAWIEQDLCDVVLAGAIEPYPHPLVRAGFNQMGVTSSEGVTRPFDKRRSGFTFGEGAGVIVLESEHHYHSRSRSPNSDTPVRISGWALGADAHSAVAFNSGGARIADVIRKSLGKAGL